MQTWKSSSALSAVNKVLPTQIVVSLKIKRRSLSHLDFVQIVFRFKTRKRKNMKDKGKKKHGLPGLL